jgi:Na+-translocating ferredoxin:NAD+ oxidoreductase subunit E
MAQSDLKRALLSENPLLVLGLGLCPACAVTVTLKDAATLGILTLFVLTASNVIVSIAHQFLAERIRSIAFVLITGSVTALACMLASQVDAVAVERLGIYAPLIAVNCVVLNRLSTIAARSGLVRSIFDGLFIGLGFLAALLLMALIREALGSNAFWGRTIIPGMEPLHALRMAPGGLIILGFLLAAASALRMRKEKGLKK